MPVSPYGDHSTTTLSNNLLCPRYAESDPSSAPPSPSSIESFDVLDSVPWRRGYISLDAAGDRTRAWAVLSKKWQKNKARIIATLILFTLFVTACTIGGYMAVRQERWRTRDMCYARGGGDRCEEVAWAKCVRVNGLGFCEGVM